MTTKLYGEAALLRKFGAKLALLSLSAIVSGGAAYAADISSANFHFRPGNLVVSRSVYDNNAANVTVGTLLPPNCGNTQAGCSAQSGAPADGSYPFVWNNDTYDGSFGITSKIYLDQITPTGSLVNTLAVPSSELITSFSSKSELALNVSTDGNYLTFMGYEAPANALDVSNSNTPGALDLTNPVGQNFYRAVARVGRNGNFTFTSTNAYSGNNGRAAILNNTDGANFFYTAGNAGNGGNPQPDGIVLGAGAQIITPAKESEGSQDPGTPTPVASFSVSELGAKPDKIGKDDNFRGLTIFDNVLYYSKGSGGNGVNTVYFVDTTGTACPNGIGLPSASASLPTSPLPYDPTTLQTTGLPSNMCILAGFPSTPNSSAKTVAYPFGIWFANSTTLYVADEGDGYTGGTDLYTHAAAQTTAGLQKWIFDSTAKMWKYAYTLQTGLDLGTPYTVLGYPTGDNPGTKLPWAPATDGLRNITGASQNDIVVIWGITSTVSGNGDQGADPNRLVAVIDSLKNSDPTVAAQEKFEPIRKARITEVLRGVSFTPGTFLAKQ